MTVVIDEEERSLPINVDPEIVSGTPVFEGTRVPVDALFNNLSAGVSLDEFLENFPSVSREQALAVLKFSSEILKKVSRAFGRNQTGTQIRRSTPIGPVDRARRRMSESE
jgi:uncharacterized protein (DUF433 family)